METRDVRGVPVEILTTCVRDHASEWVDHHPAGTTDEEGLVVRRFKTRPRDPERRHPRLRVATATRLFVAERSER